MNIAKRISGLLALLVLASGVANAEDSNWGVGIKAGTLGYGAEARWSGLPWMDLRIGGNTFSRDDNSRYENVRYDTELTLETYYLTANFHFPLSPFRFTAGAFSNDNELAMVGAEPVAYDFGGPATWTPAQVGTLNGTTSFSSTSPYAGIGYDFEMFGKVGLNFDLGVLFQGEPEVILVATGGTDSTDPVLVSELAIESQRVEASLGRYKAYPVVSLSFVYNF